MSQKRWDEIVGELGEIFPLEPEPEPGRKFPSLAHAIDDGVNDLLKDGGLEPSQVNPLYVEDLLRDCVTRVSNCMSIRERAQEVETRALSDALHYKIQSAALRANAAIASVLDPITPRMGQNATSAALTGAAASFQGEDARWQEANAHRDVLAKESREALDALKTKATASGNGANYVERFAFLKRLFDLNMVECYRRARVCATALQRIYGIDLPVPKVKPAGYLDELAVWAQRASDQLDEALDSRYLGQVAFALSGRGTEPLLPHELLPKARYEQFLATGRIVFTLDEVPFKSAGMKDVLLRSVRIQVRAKDDTRVRVWPATIHLPKSAVTGQKEAFATLASSAYEMPADAASMVRGVHNIGLAGEWELVLPPHSITGDATSNAEVLNVYLILGVSYRKA